MKFPSGKTFAVVVGVSDYQWLSAKTGDLLGADADAKRMMAFLQTNRGGRVPLHRIRLLLNRAATRQSILSALRLFQQAQPQDRILFFFSGHGAERGFVPYEMRGGKTPCLSYDDVKAAFRASPAHTKLCIADACLSGGMRESSQQNSGPARWQESNSEDSQANTAMILSSRGNQGSYENRALRGGVFTHFLLDGLNGKADTNDNRTVTIRELYEYMAPRIRQTTPNRQRTVMYGHFQDELPLATW